MRPVQLMAILLGLVSIFVSWGPLHNLFRENPDNAAGVYVMFGGPFLIAGILLIVWGVRASRRADIEGP